MVFVEIVFLTKELNQMEESDCKLDVSPRVSPCCQIRWGAWGGQQSSLEHKGHNIHLRSTTGEPRSTTKLGQAYAS